MMHQLRGHASILTAVATAAALVIATAPNNAVASPALSDTDESSQLPPCDDFADLPPYEPPAPDETIEELTLVVFCVDVSPEPVGPGVPPPVSIVARRFATIDVRPFTEGTAVAGERIMGGHVTVKANPAYSFKYVEVIGIEFAPAKLATPPPLPPLDSILTAVGFTLWFGLINPHVVVREAGAVTEPKVLFNAQSGYGPRKVVTTGRCKSANVNGVLPFELIRITVKEAIASFTYSKDGQTESGVASLLSNEADRYRYGFCV